MDKKTDVVYVYVSSNFTADNDFTCKHYQLTGEIVLIYSIDDIIRLTLLN